MIAMTGVMLIEVERQRQQAPLKDGGEGYDALHDRGAADELALAGATYATPARHRFRLPKLATPVFWPWRFALWRPTPDDRVRELVKAGALIAAAIDSLLEQQEREARNAKVG